MRLDFYLRAFRPEEMAETARRAEALGLDALWVGESTHNPFLGLMLAAEHTSTLRLGTAVALAFPRSPTLTAHLAWDLQAFSRGRFLLGLGSQVRGHIERRFGMPYDPPGPRLRDYLGALRAVWDCWQRGTPLQYRGRFYTLTLMTPFFNPGPIEHPHIPVYISAVNPYMLRLAGEACEGVHLHPLHSVRYLRELALPLIQEGLRKAGRRREDISLAVTVFTVTGETPQEVEEARAFVRRQIAFYASTPPYRRVLALHGWEETARRLSEMARAGEWEGMPGEITDEMVETFALVAPLDRLGAALRERYEGLVDRVAFYRPPRPLTDTAFWERTVRDFYGG